MAEVLAWLIIGLPLLAGAVIIGVVRPWSRAPWPLAGAVGIAGVGGAFALSLVAVNAAGNGGAGYAPHAWFTVGEPGSSAAFEMTVGVLLDPLAAIMAAVVSGVSMLVQVYSLGYMRKDADAEGGEWVDYPRYFAYMSLFTASMLGLVLAYNLVQMFVFWELVGLFSYLLIGFWSHRPAAVAAAKKAFIVTRIGDFGFLLGMMYLYFNREAFLDLGLNPFEIPAILEAAPMLSAGVATWVALGLFAGAVGKSAQFPLHTWLPDAMEGPTPVSSLIHAATMVAAGVYLVARMFGLFEESAAAMNAVALIGGFTAVFAAAMGLAANDIKRVLAFSTVSQLGYMFLALGVGAPGAAMFHLFNHAFFKCLLFLAAGSVHHSTHTFDMRLMGGVRKWMPVTYATTLIGGLSLAGVFPLAGFWSKDEVLGAAFSGAHAANDGVAMLVFWLGLAAAFMTAFYVFRLVLMTFHGDFKGGIDAVSHDERIPDEAHHHVHRAESPLSMTAPMVVLAVFAVGSGFVANALWDLGPVPAHWFAHYLHVEAAKINVGVALGSTFVALAGIGLAVLVYETRTVSLDGLGRVGRFAHRTLAERFYFDRLYEDLIVRYALYRGLFLASDWVDRRIVDGFVDLAGWFGRNTGRAVAQLQTGQTQAYGVGVSMGLIVILMFYLLR